VFSEDDLLPLSALQHLVFCERQCALIHLEQVWEDNPLTVQGQQLHEKVDGGIGESRGDLRVARGLPLRSFRLGLAGRADAVELHRLPADEPGALLPDGSGPWRPFPVEYKRGEPKAHRADEVQICAQALCLEEMLNAPVPAGALFYGEPRRRQDLSFDRELRELTEQTAERLHRMIASGVTPPPVREPKCDRCSLIGICLPAAPSHSARAYLSALVRDEPLPEPRKTRTRRRTA
jgi:CRISPR-associated exonuclease Cas4